MDHRANLKKYLKTIPAGPIEDEDQHAEVSSMIADAWDNFSPLKGGMTPAKILGRLENLEWDPPNLSFIIERHGAFVLGSTRAELQAWTLNLESNEANCSSSGFRQLGKPRPRLNTQPIAVDIARLIKDKTEDPRIKWLPDGKVRIVAGAIIPNEDGIAKETLAGRRKKFRTHLKDELAKLGWREVRANLFERAP